MSSFNPQYHRANTNDSELALQGGLYSPQSPPLYDTVHGRSLSSPSVTIPIYDHGRGGGNPYGDNGKKPEGYFQEKGAAIKPVKYNAWLQFLRNFRRLLARWLMTLLFCGLTVLLYRRTAEMGTLKSWGKKVFNALSIALSIVMGLNLVSALKSMADMMKWSILAGGRWTPQEVELILCMTSYQRALKLLTVWGVKRLRASFILTAWVLIGIGAQAAVAILGLTYNQESDGATFTVLDRVNVTKLDHFYPVTGSFVGDESGIQAWQEDYTAHFYGDAMQALFTPDSLSKIDTGPSGIGDPADVFLVPLFGDDNETVTGLTYNYTDYTESKNPGEIIYRPSKSNRTVTIQAQCETKAESEVDFVIQANGTTYDYAGIVETFKTGENGRTFIRFDDENCGSRCAVVHVVQSPETPETWNGTQDENGAYTSMPAALFECHVNVSHVSNAWQPEHILNDTVALRAAGAIGREGWYYGGYFQSVLYNNGSLWGELDKDPNEIALLLAVFTAGSLANMDKYNPRVDVPGWAVHLGTKLDVNWLYVYICLGCILGGHGLLAVFVCIRAGWVFCKHDSPLATARLLRPLVEELGASGSAATGEKIAEVITDRRTYGARPKRDGTGYHLELGQFDLRSRQQKHFPPGLYD